VTGLTVLGYPSAMRRALLAVAAALVALGAALWWALAPPAPLALPERGALLTGVTVVNPGAGREEGRTVRVDGARIASVEASAAPPEPAPRFVLPGLVDMHVHFPPPMGLAQTELFAFLFLYHGVTSVRDAGDVDGTATAPARDGAREGRFPGPRVFACGPFLDGAPPAWPNTLVVRDAAEARAAVARIAAAGFDCVKAYDRLPAEALRAAQEEAAARGLPVIGHVPRAVSYFEARLDDVQHLTGAVRDEGDLRPFPAVLAPWEAVSDAELRAIARRTAELGIANTPTLVVGERIAATRDLAASRSAPGARLLPRLYRDVVWSREGSRLLRELTPADYALLEAAHARERRLVRELRDAGAPLHAGSDVLNPFVVPGESLHRELALLVEAGLTPEEAWVAATRAPGDFLGRRGLAGLGRVEAGAPADLLVYREDPPRDLAALATLEAVVADGRLYPRAALDAQLARLRAYGEGWLFDRLSVAAARRVLARLAAQAPPPR
jgi:imidazolonepropionase-like amidohydrolase